MKQNELSPGKALNKAFLKVKVSKKEIDNFRTEFKKLLESINEKESEEFDKNLVSDFLKMTYYNPDYFINTKGKTDLVIHNGKNAKNAVGVIIETKKPGNKTEMLRPDDFNIKAFQQLVLYYLRERISGDNREIRHLIATNIYEWFIFDADVFERIFARNKDLVTEFKNFEDKKLQLLTPDFYKKIAGSAIEEIETKIEFTYFDIRTYKKLLESDETEDANRLIRLYKLLSPEHLLKLPFVNDSNTLDKAFYAELLHIIGLTETKEGGKKIIRRKAKGEQNPGSLLENAIAKLGTPEKMNQIKEMGQFGETKQDMLYNSGLGLTITWMNRLLFLKLLEAQLMTYYKGDKSYLFLNHHKIKDFSILNRLFFDVLAKETHKRDENIKQIFEKIPYLNSSLFEKTELEKNLLVIKDLDTEKRLPLSSSTVLKDRDGKRLTGEINTLEYLFRFLDSYDFASEGAEEVQDQRKSLISASVLGLIFEKINGYKEGSYFTPGFITMYMCRETIRRVVIQKFNETKGWNCKNFVDLYNKIEDLREANEIINSLRICDPAVGSGHFLVSALNEIIAIKSDLQILQDSHGRRLKYHKAEVVNDELMITDEDGEFFRYRPKNEECRRIQETLFHEKQMIIENCLFGVDINPNAEKICCLRLWIELLKHAYYQDNEELKTLPNIDINIKHGNSLINRYPLDMDLKQNKQKKISEYRMAVQTYRNAKSKTVKDELKNLIGTIKKDFRIDLGGNNPKKKQLTKLGGNLYDLVTRQKLPGFEETAKEKKAREQKQKKLEKEIAKLRAEVDELESGRIYDNAFEWRFEFPEVLDDDGEFVGFDMVIGNPPYGVKCSSNNRKYFKISFNTQDDIYAQFFELGLRILKAQGIESFITPIAWLNGYNYFNTRKMIKNNATLILGIILSYDVFADAYVDTGIFCIRKGHASEAALVHAYDIRDKVDYQVLLETPFQKLDVNSWTLNNDLSIVFDSFWRELKIKIYEQNDSFESLTTSFRGILAPNESYNASKIDNSFKPVFVSSFDRYDSTFETIKFVDYSSIKEGPKKINAFEGQKLFVRRIVNRQLRIMATYSDGSFVVKKDIYVFKPVSKDKSILSLLAIINSRLISFLLTKGSSAARKDDFTQITLTDIRKIGVPHISSEVKKIFDKKVSQILTAKKQNPKADTSALEKKIDQLVYELYGLTEEEIAIIEKEDTK